MLYIHMAGLLNDLFFPKANLHNTKIYSAIAFCSTYLVIPFGGIILGWLGDKIGRKRVVVLTIFIMSATCFTITILPTYEQIGITATYIITICRAIQGLAFMAEFIGV